MDETNATRLENPYKPKKKKDGILNMGRSESESSLALEPSRLDSGIDHYNIGSLVPSEQTGRDDTYTTELSRSKRDRAVSQAGIN
jgi:hypothetical protein